MQNRKKIALKPDFVRAGQKAYEVLVKQGIHAFPIDPFAILQELEESCHIYSWTDLREATQVEDPFSLKKLDIQAKTHIIRGDQDYMIVYDEKALAQRVRWTVAHEIGHIVLGHLTDYENTGHTEKLTKDEYQTLEVEAHWFAGILLAPHAVLRNYEIYRPEDIAQICQISMEAAHKCQTYIRKPCYQQSPKEWQTILNFHPYFCQFILAPS